MTDKLSLKSRLADGKTKEVIEELHQLTTDTDTDLHNEVVAISARFNQYAREERQNLKDTQTLNIELAHIRQAVLYIIDRFDPNLKAPPKSFLDGLWRYKNWAFMIGVAIIMAILAIQLLDSKNKTFQYTVYVHGKGGKTDKVLRGEGFVRLYLNSDPKKQKIDEDGRAVFTEISPTFLGKSIRIDIEHPQPYQTIHPDSLFILTDNGVVDLAIALQGTNKLIGKVMDEATNDFLDSVRVSVFNIETFTDKNGYFELTIPEAKQEKFQKVFFEKKGYELYLQDSVPLHTHQQMIVGMKRKSK